MAQRIFSSDFNRSARWQRVTLADDGQGGQRETFVEVAAKIKYRCGQPTAAEREVGAQSGSDIDASLYFEPGTAVRRGDLFDDLDTDEVWEVESVLRPSEDVYVKALASLRQGDGNG